LGEIDIQIWYLFLTLKPQSRSMGEKVHGQYSYVDPLGSLIVVKYSTNPDGSDFVEKREMNLNYR